VESTYEPAMTKAFLHGRTEAIRTVQPESVAFVKVSTDLVLYKEEIPNADYSGSSHSAQRRQHHRRRLQRCEKHVNSMVNSRKTVPQD
jgi:hypothetical protein